MACKTGFSRWNINLFMHKNVDTLYVLKIELLPGYFRTSVIIYMNMYFQISYSSRN